MFPHTFESSKSNQMKSIITAVILFIATAAFAQNTISGKVVDKRKIYCGANIYIDGTYDGATTNENGQFSFSTTATGNQVLIASFLVYETSKTTINVAFSK
jgi:uncharacterized protein with FMN-binding domain